MGDLNYFDCTTKKSPQTANDLKTEDDTKTLLFINDYEKG